MLVDLITAAVLAFFAIRLGSAARYSLFGGGKGRAAQILAGIRWRHIWPVPLVFAAVAVVGTLLVQVPVLSFGWWSALGGAGNPVFGSSERTTGTVLEWLIPLVFVALLLPALPLFALREEELFRAGAETWSPVRRVERAVFFGLAHALIGIPIGFALALSIGGGYFQVVYLREFRRTASRFEATMESARAHTAYNAAIVMLLLVYLVAVATGAATA